MRGQFFGTSEGLISWSLSGEDCCSCDLKFIFPAAAVHLFLMRKCGRWVLGIMNMDYIRIVFTYVVAAWWSGVATEFHRPTTDVWRRMEGKIY